MPHPISIILLLPPTKFIQVHIICFRSPEPKLPTTICRIEFLNFSLTAYRCQKVSLLGLQHDNLRFHLIVSDLCELLILGPTGGADHLGDVLPLLGGGEVERVEEEAVHGSTGKEFIILQA